MQNLSSNDKIGECIYKLKLCNDRNIIKPILKERLELLDKLSIKNRLNNLKLSNNSSVDDKIRFLEKVFIEPIDTEKLQYIEEKVDIIKYADKICEIQESEKGRLDTVILMLLYM